MARKTAWKCPTNLYAWAKEAFPDVYVSVEAISETSVTATFRDNDLSYEQLLVLSEAFGTRKINVGSETRDDGYCETCSSPYSVCVVKISAVTRWPGEEG